MVLNDHHGDGRFAIWCAAEPGVQGMLVGADPESYFVPPYVGHRGWLGVRLDRDLPENEIAGLLEDAYGEVAPPRTGTRRIDVVRLGVFIGCRRTPGKERAMAFSKLLTSMSAALDRRFGWDRLPRRSESSRSSGCGRACGSRICYDTGTTELGSP